MIGMHAHAYYAGFAARGGKLSDGGAQSDQRPESERQAHCRLRRGGQGHHLLNYLGFGGDTLEYVVDKNMHKQGMYMPGVHLRIEDPSGLQKTDPTLL